MPPRPQARLPTRLYLITPPVKDARRFAADLATALDAGGFAAVLLNFADEQEAEPAEAVAALVPLVQGRGIALLVNGSTELARSEERRVGKECRSGWWRGASRDE